MSQVQEPQVMRKIFLRIVPLLAFLYVLSYIDRINVSFAALTMNKDIGLDAYTYGWGAGIFFLGYCLFEVPSNLALVRVGARRWIARIAFTWGILACAMAWVHSSTSFLVMRFLLGAAEAGFFPGVILYLTYWFPSRYRARIISAFMLSIPLSLAIGAPISTALLHLHGLLGLKGWQWLFIVEGIPPVLMAFVVLAMLPDNPASARWLSGDEKRWLTEELARETTPASSARHEGIASAFTNPAILALCFIYFCAAAANLGLSLFLPQIIKAQGYTMMQTGLITSIPYVFGCIGMLVIGNLSDRFNERKVFLLASMVIAALGLGLAGWLGSTAGAIMALCLATIGIMGCKGPFWPLPSSYLSGAAAAAGIAFINSIGNLGGFVGPYLVGWAKDATGKFESGFYLLALLALAASFVTGLCVNKQAGKGRSVMPIPGAADQHPV